MNERKVKNRAQNVVFVSLKKRNIFLTIGKTTFHHLENYFPPQAKENAEITFLINCFPPNQSL